MKPVETTALYHVWLQSVLGYESPKARGVMEKFGGAKALYNSSYQEKLKARLFTEKELLRAGDKSLEKVQKAIEFCKLKGINILTYEDRLYPQRLKNIYNPPVVLYYKGKMPEIDTNVFVSIIGTRYATQYGMNLTLNLGYRLTRSGVNVVSGGAFGIDTQALIGSLKAGGNPVCVLGGGLDKYYPKQNTALFDEIAKRGLLISEYPLGTNPIPRNFPARNRIVAGLSLGTVVVEAPKKSGALITANLSLEQGKDVFAVPGNIGSEVSFGTNELLKMGASPLTSYYDVVDMYIDRYPGKLRRLSQTKIELRSKQGTTPPRRREAKQKDDRTNNAGEKQDKPRQKKNIEGLSENANKLYNSVGIELNTIDELAVKSGLEIKDALMALSELQISGAVERRSGGRYTFSG